MATTLSKNELEKQKQKSYEAGQDIRTKGVGAAYEVARVAGTAPGRLRAAGEQARVSLRQRSAQALGTAMGQAGRMATGGGQAAALRQAGLRSGAAEGVFAMDQAERMADARYQASMSQLEAVKFEAEAGDPWGARREAINFYTTELIKAKAAEMNSSEINQLIRDWLVAETDPVLIQWLQGRAGIGPGGYTTPVTHPAGSAKKTTFLDDSGNWVEGAVDDAGDFVEGVVEGVSDVVTSGWESFKSLWS
jgi:hypothetical protein